MKKPLATMIPLLTRGLAPTAAIASSLLSPLAIAGSGDLDPSFGDAGRVGPLSDFDGPAWSIQALEDGEILFGGGDTEFSCGDHYCDLIVLDASGFVNRASDAGSLDLTSDAAVLRTTQVLDVVPQPDGKVIAVGRTVTPVFTAQRRTSQVSALTVFRLARNGSLDPTFGIGGIFRLPADRNSQHEGTSVALDPDRRIVVAGWRFTGRELIVLRLLADGTLDDSFGVGGIFTGFGDFGGSPIRVLRTAGGGYRVANANTGGRCLVLALTAAGAVDVTFGSSGVAAPETPSGNAVACSSMALQADGRLLLTGSNAEGAFATRLRTNGTRDQSFSAVDVTTAMTVATALAVREDESIIVAGVARGTGNIRDGVSDALIMQLQASGDLDPLFGIQGSAWIELPSANGSDPIVRDLAVLPDGRVLAAGGDYFGTSDNLLAGTHAHPFVVRLTGDADDDGPGVLGVRNPSIVLNESEQAVIIVRRTGGDSGSVSIAYETVTGGPVPATGGEDYTQVTGRLHWADGDTRDQEIRVPIASDDQSREATEQFLVVLSDTDGDAGIGTRHATVHIVGDGTAHGEFAIEVPTPVISESQLVAVRVHRNYYFNGAVSVTVTPTAKTASAGDDFDARPVTLSWADGEHGARSFSIAIRDDANAEQSETFTVELSKPTGGAIIGPRSSATITIQANDQPAPSPPGNAQPGLDRTSATVGEAGGSVVLNVFLSAVPASAVSVNYATSSGSATAGTDFTSANGTLTWAAADTAVKTITVNITNDSADETDETFTVALSNPAGGVTLGPNPSAIVTITDDDSPPPPTPPDQRSERGGGGALDWVVAVLLAGLNRHRRKPILRGIRANATSRAGSWGASATD